MEENNESNESILERILSFAKEFFSRPWMYSSLEEGYLLPETRRRTYEAMGRYT